MNQSLILEACKEAVTLTSCNCINNECNGTCTHAKLNSAIAELSKQQSPSKLAFNQSLHRFNKCVDGISGAEVRAVRYFDEEVCMTVSDDKKADAFGVYINLDYDTQKKFDLGPSYWIADFGTRRAAESLASFLQTLVGNPFSPSRIVNNETINIKEAAEAFKNPSLPSNPIPFLLALLKGCYVNGSDYMTFPYARKIMFTLCNMTYGQLFSIDSVKEFEYLTGKQSAMKAKKIWEGIGTYDRISLVDKYGKGMMPYELQKPSDEQIESILSAAKDDGYLLTPLEK